MTTEPPWFPRRALEAAVLCVLVIIGSAGLLKLADLNGFARSLDTWSLIGAPLRGLALYTVPTAEVFLASSWLFGRGRAWIVWCAVMLLSLFTLTYAIHVVTVGAPDCDCFGAWFRYRALQSSAWWNLGKNGALCAPLLLYLVFGRRAKGPRDESAP